MAPDMRHSALICICALSFFAYSMPSFDHGSFDSGSPLALGSVLTPRSAPFEIRCVYGGRKKRYIVERVEPSSCCKEKVICFPSVGEILKDCKCSKCPPGLFPALGGNECQNKCPDGQEKTSKDGCCPAGQQAKADGKECEPKPSDNDRKGKCPGDTVLDIKHGWDPKPQEPRCQIDDEKDCPKPEVPETRRDGLEMNTSFKPKCGEPDQDESKRPKCYPKTEYVHTEVDVAGKATQTCETTRKYNDRKRGKPTNSELRVKIKDMWTKAKPENDKRNKERKENTEKLRKLRDENYQREKERGELQESNGKKKTRMGKCGPVVALLIGAAAKLAENAKREDEHPYEWTTDYFDESFVGSNDRLKDWPAGIDVNTISKDVEELKWADRWQSDLDDKRKKYSSWCNFKRSLEARCSAKRSVEDDWYEDEDDLDDHFQNVTSSVIERHTGAIVESYSRELIALEERNPFLAIFENIAAFSVRLAVQIVPRITMSIAARVPRLANLARNSDRLFKIAKDGEGT